MALASDIMLGGFSAMSARAIGGQVKTGIAAAGTIITDATDLSHSINVLSTAAQYHQISSTQVVAFLSA